MWNNKETEKRDRNHDYLYTVLVRKPSEGKKFSTEWVPQEWEEKQVEASNIDQAAHKLGEKLNDIIYLRKVVIK